MVRLEGLEPPTYCLEGSCSIQLSYKRLSIIKNALEPKTAASGRAFWSR